MDPNTQEPEDSQEFPLPPEPPDDRFSFASNSSIFEEFKTPSRAMNTDLTKPAEAFPDEFGENTSEDRFIGETIDNFLILSRLGSGGFGVVYKARDAKLHRLVAVKFLHFPRNREFLRRFEREARVLANLSKHPNIVQIYSWGEHKGESFFVLEHMDYGADDLLKRSPEGLGLLRVLEIGRDCARALAHAHANKVLHRDIKPGNILIDNNTGTAKLCDFGLAISYALGDEPSVSMLAGSPVYMSPEQAAGEDLDERSDIYSLGISLFRLLTGAFPFATPDDGKEVGRIDRTKQTSVSELRPELPEAAAAIIDRCIRPLPADRYQTAEDLRADLESVLDALQRTGTAGPGNTPVEPSSKKRLRVVLPATAVFLFVPAVAFIVGWDTGGATPDGPGADAGMQNARIAVPGAASGDFAAAVEQFRDRMTARHVSAADREAIRQQIEHVREVKQRLETSAAAADPAGFWNSRPIRLRISPPSPGNSELAVQSGLTNVLPVLLADEVAEDPPYPIDIVDRKYLGNLLYEQELADLSQEMDRVQLGRLLGATHMIELEFSRMFEDNFLTIKIIDTGTSQVAQAETLAFDESVDPKDWIASAADTLLTELRAEFPLRGRLTVKNDVATIDIGKTVGVEQGMMFRVLTKPALEHELENVKARVSGSVAPGSAQVVLDGASLAAVPDGGWYVQQLPQ